MISSRLTNSHLFRKASQIDLAAVLKTVMRLHIGVRVLCLPPSFRLCSSTELERRSTKPKVVSSNLTEASKLFRGRPVEGRSSLERETKVRILSPKPTIFLGVPQAAIRACFGNKCSQVRILPPRPNFSCRRGLNGKGAGLRNQFMRVRISPSVLNFSG